MRKVQMLPLMLLCVLVLTGCGGEKASPDAAAFKLEYEKMNGQSGMGGDEVYQTLSLPEDNPFVYVKSEALEALLSEGTGALYLGFPECPWCRTLLPSLLEAAKASGYDGPIYYYNALDERDVRSLNDAGEIVVEEEGSALYRSLLEMLGDHLSPYDGLGDDSIKRIYFPTTVFFKDGEILSVHLNTVDSQTDAYAALDEAQAQELLDSLTEQFSKITQ